MNIEVWILIQHIASKNFQIQLITYESHKQQRSVVDEVSCIHRCIGCIVVE